LPVIICFVVVGIEHLHFITPGEIYAAVPAALASAFHHFGRSPFNVQLAIAKTLFRRNASRFIHGRYSITYFPPRFPTFAALPLRQIFAIDQDNGIGWWRSGIDDTWFVFRRRNLPLFGRENWQSQLEQKRGQRQKTKARGF